MIYKYNLIRSETWALEIEADNEAEASEILHDTLYNTDFLSSTSVETLEIKKLNK